MAIKLNEIAEYSKLIYTKRRKKEGFFLFVLLMIVFLIWIPPINHIQIKYRTIIFIITIVISFNFWLYISGRMIIRTKKIKIGLALKANDKNGQPILDKMNSMLIEELRNLDILDKFKILKIGSDVCKTISNAKKYTAKWDINLVILGTIYSGKEEAKYKYYIKDPVFTYRIYNIPKDDQIISRIKKDIDLMILNRKWIIEESNDLMDTNKIAKNLTEIVLSLLSITLFRDKKHTDVYVQIIRKVMPYLESHIPDEKRKILIDKEKHKMAMSIDLLRSGRLREILKWSYISAADIYFEQQNYKKALDILLEGLKNGSDKLQSYGKIAFTYYYLGGIEKSEEFTDKLNEIKKDTLEYCINKAFFSIRKQHYNKVIEYYEKTRKKFKSKNKLYIQDVINFLKQRLKEEPFEVAYKYAYGILTYDFLDKKEGKVILLDFYKRADDKKYHVLTDKVKFIFKIKSP